MANERDVCDCKVSVVIEEEENTHKQKKTVYLFKPLIYRRFRHTNNTWEKQCKIILFEVIDCCRLCLCVFVQWVSVCVCFFLCVNELNYVMTRLLHRRPYCDKPIIIHAAGKSGSCVLVVLPSAHSRQWILTPVTTEWLVCVCVRALCVDGVEQHGYDLITPFREIIHSSSSSSSSSSSLRIAPNIAIRQQTANKKTCVCVCVCVDLKAHTAASVCARARVSVSFSVCVSVRARVCVLCGENKRAHLVISSVARRFPISPRTDVWTCVRPSAFQVIVSKGAN